MTTQNWNLQGYGGLLPWSEVRSHLGEATCTWQDLEGLHLAAAPDAAPISTHLWGWSSNRCFRARIDGEHAYLAALTQDGSGTHVNVIIRPSLLRNAEYFTAEGDIPDLELLETTGRAPATFLRPARNQTST